MTLKEGPRNVTRTLKLLLVVATLPLLAHLGGCAVAAGGAVAGTASTANDRRTTGTMVDDQSIEFQITDMVHADQDVWNRVHVNATAFNGILLLTGEVPEEALRADIATRAAGIRKVRVVHNELVLSTPSDVVDRSADSWLTGKVKTTRNDHASYIRFTSADGSDALYASWAEAADTPAFADVAGKAGLLVAPSDTDYGLREFALLDNDGNLLRIGGTIPD